MDETTKPMAALIEDGTVTLDGAIAEFGISRSQLYDEMKAGNLPYFQFGRRRLVPRKALKMLITTKDIQSRALAATEETT